MNTQLAILIGVVIVVIIVAKIILKSITKVVVVGLLVSTALYFGFGVNIIKEIQSNNELTQSVSGAYSKYSTQIKENAEIKAYLDELKQKAISEGKALTEAQIEAYLKEKGFDVNTSN